ncbi:hypothetical protein [Mesomycoplasma conjunctivae]|uniref:hypothetical protein n=1 Tax=Mesomycoplasma conjunctivae TaxID=45361 RepID=UPI003DA3A8FB
MNKFLKIGLILAGFGATLAISIGAASAVASRSTLISRYSTTVSNWSQFLPGVKKTGLILNYSANLSENTEKVNKILKTFDETSLRQNPTFVQQAIDALAKTDVKNEYFVNVAKAWNLNLAAGLEEDLPSYDFWTKRINEATQLEAQLQISNQLNTFLLLHTIGSNVLSTLALTPVAQKVYADRYNNATNPKLLFAAIGKSKPENTIAKNIQAQIATIGGFAKDTTNSGTNSTNASTILQIQSKYNDIFFAAHPETYKQISEKLATVIKTINEKQAQDGQLKTLLTEATNYKPTVTEQTKTEGTKTSEAPKQEQPNQSVETSPASQATSTDPKLPIAKPGKITPVVVIGIPESK